MPGSVGGQSGLHRSAFPRPFDITGIGQHYSFARGKGMPSEKDTMQCRCVERSVFPRVLGDIRLRDRQNAAREHIPLPG